MSLAGVRARIDNPDLSWNLLICGAFAFLTFPRMAQVGMFLDGITYAAISRNLADGIGTFWAPFYTATLYPTFHEHPPLGFALEGAAFALAGDHLAVERAYSWVVGMLTAVLIAALWRHAFHDRRYQWLPLLFWLLPSTVTWAIVNNILENTQAFFSIFAIFAFVRSLDSGRSSLWAASSGLAVVAAVLTKGPVGLFPLAAPGAAALLFRDRRGQVCRSGAGMAAMVAAAAGFLWWNETSRTALSLYLDQQVIASMAGTRGGGRWINLVRHLSGGVVMRMGGLFALMLVSGWRSRTPARDVDRAALRQALFFLVMAIAGSVPVAFSARIMGHYFVPSIPVYALAFAGLTHVLWRPGVEALRRRGSVAAGWVAAVLIIATGGFLVARRPFEARDVDWTADFRRIDPVVVRGAVIGTCESARTDWRLHAYMQRLFTVSLAAGASDRRQFIQVGRDCDAPAGCHVAVSGTRLSLFSCSLERQ